MIRGITSGTNGTGVHKGLGVAGHVRPLEALFNEVQVVVESRVASKLRGVSTLEHLGLGGVEHKLTVRRGLNRPGRCSCNTERG